MKRLRLQTEKKFEEIAKEYKGCFIFYPHPSTPVLINWLYPCSMVFKNMRTGFSTVDLRKIPIKIIQEGIEEIKKKISGGI